MTDTLITPETARIAKEKGFNNWETDLNEEFFGRPTQSLLAKWLRDRGIHVWVYPHLGTEVWYTGAIWGVGSQAARELNNFDSSYEEALEKGLQEGLKLI